MATPARAEPGSDLAVRRLVAQASKRGYAIAYDLLRDRAEAEDAVQDALVRAIAWLPKLRDAGALEVWFYRTLANGCIRTLRRRRVALAFARLVGRGEPAGELDSAAGDHARMLAAIEELPAMQKAALVLRHGHELSLDEVAGVLGVGGETVKTHLKRARAHLRHRLGVP